MTNKKWTAAIIAAAIISFSPGGFIFPASGECAPIEGLKSELSGGTIGGSRAPGAGNNGEPVMVAASVPSRAATITDTDPSGTNVRSAPNGTIIGKLSHGDKIEVIGEESGWYKINYRGGTGYVSKSCAGEAGAASSRSASQNYVDNSWKSKWQYDYVISSEAFTDYNCMNADQIHDFLKKNGSVLSKQVDGEWPADIIYAAAQKYKISPKVILARLQVEQQLITRSSAGAEDLNWAMGSGSYDEGEWGREYSGFKKQVFSGAATLRIHYDDARKIVQNGQHLTTVVDGARERVCNSATYALYKYTPNTHGAKLFRSIYLEYFE